MIISNEFILIACCLISFISGLIRVRKLDKDIKNKWNDENQKGYIVALEVIRREFGDYEKRIK
jgi:hypothetical protein